MDLSEIVGITGMPGLFKVASRRSDGVIVTSLVDGKTQFVSARTHPVSPLDSISIFTTDEEPAMLKDVLAAIKKKEGKTPVPDVKNDAALKAWLEAVLPTYDKEKVHVSDMRKLAKWYNLLNEKSLIEELTTDKTKEEVTEAKEEVVKEVKKESKPKAVKTAKSAKAQSKPAPVKKITTPRKAT